MKPPIKVTASTDNRNVVALRIAGEGEEDMKLEAPHAGSAYQTTHAFAPLLEAAINGILANHGIMPEQPKAKRAKKAAAPAPVKKARAKKK